MQCENIIILGTIGRGNMLCAYFWKIVYDIHFIYILSQIDNIHGLDIVYSTYCEVNMCCQGIERLEVGGSFIGPTEDFYY